MQVVVEVVYGDLGFEAPLNLIYSSDGRRDDIPILSPSPLTISSSNEIFFASRTRSIPKQAEKAVVSLPKNIQVRASLIANVRAVCASCAGDAKWTCTIVGLAT